MFKASDLKRALDCMLDSPTATAVVMVVLLAMPVVATSGAPGIESRVIPRSGAYPEAFEGPYNYQMRCWQHGHLVSAQNLVELPADAPDHAFRESGSDRDGRPVYSAETGNAVCLIRGVVNPGAPPRH